MPVTADEVRGLAGLTMPIVGASEVIALLGMMTANVVVEREGHPAVCAGGVWERFCHAASRSVFCGYYPALHNQRRSSIHSADGSFR